MTKYLVLSLSVIALFSNAHSKPRCGAGPLGLTYCGMKWEDYFDGSNDSQLGRKNQCKNGCGGNSYGTRTDNYGGGGQSGGDQFNAQSGQNYASSGGYKTQGSEYGVSSGSNYATTSNGIYVNEFQLNGSGGTSSNNAGSAQGGDYVQGSSNMGYSSSSTMSGQGSFGQSIGQSLVYVNGPEQSTNGMSIIDNVESDQENSYTQSSNGGNSNTFTTNGQGSAVSQSSSWADIYLNSLKASGNGGSANNDVRSDQGSGVEQSSGSFLSRGNNADIWNSGSNSRRCSTCGGSRTYLGNGLDNVNTVHISQ